MALVPDPTPVIAQPEQNSAKPSGGVQLPHPSEVEEMETKRYLEQFKVPDTSNIYPAGSREGLPPPNIDLPDEAGAVLTIVIDGYQYEFLMKDYPSYKKAIREAVYLMNYDSDFRSWFSEKLDQYTIQTSPFHYQVNSGFARNDFEKFLVQHPLWEPDPAHAVREGEIENYSLTRDEAISYYSQTLGIELKELREKQAAQAMEAAKQRDAQLEQQRLIAENTRKSHETLLQYLARAFAAPEGTSRSYEDFFNRVVPRLMSTVPAIGSIAASQTGNPMDAFQYYILAQQAQNLMYPFISKSGKTVSYGARPIYNIKNYYPRYEKVTKPRVKRRG